MNKHRGQEWFCRQKFESFRFVEICLKKTCLHVKLETVVVKGEGGEDGQSLHCQVEGCLEAALAFRAGSEENARMKEAEAS